MAMLEPIQVRKRPITVQAIRWTGDNLDAVRRFTDNRFDPIDCLHPDLTARVYDKLHSKWIPLGTGDWVIRGTHGECYPCNEAVFAETYEPVTTDEHV